MNVNLLKSKMALAGDKMQELGLCLGVTVSAISNKINGKVDFSRSDIQKVIERYNLTPDETHAIFFTENVVDFNNTKDEREV